MQDNGMANPFAPPIANVVDHVDTHVTGMVEATRGQRFLAFLIDCTPGFVIGVAGAITAFAYFRSHPGADFGQIAVAFGVFGALFFAGMLAWLVYNIVLVYRYGQIFGKRMMGIRVVRTDGSRVSFPRFIFLRWLPLAILGGVLGAILGRSGHPFWSYLVGFVDILFIFRASRQCLHDTIADTRVVTAESSESATLAGARRPALRSANF